jgi:putative ribosome biogenesis GTPase RsgA
LQIQQAHAASETSSISTRGNDTTTHLQLFHSRHSMIKTIDSVDFTGRLADTPNESNISRNQFEMCDTNRRHIGTTASFRRKKHSEIMVSQPKVLAVSSNTWMDLFQHPGVSGMTLQ